MVANFDAGGAAINQLCKLQNAELAVIPLDLDTPTADFTETPAMTEAETVAASIPDWPLLAMVWTFSVLARWGLVIPPLPQRSVTQFLAGNLQIGQGPVLA